MDVKKRGTAMRNRRQCCGRAPQASKMSHAVIRCCFGRKQIAAHAALRRLSGYAAEPVVPGSRCLEGGALVLRPRLTSERAIMRIESDIGYGGDGASSRLSATPAVRAVRQPNDRKRARSRSPNRLLEGAIPDRSFDSQGAPDHRQHTRSSDTCSRLQMGAFRRRAG
jgi:hypothetical protein